VKKKYFFKRIVHTISDLIMFVYQNTRLIEFDCLNSFDMQYNVISVITFQDIGRTFVVTDSASCLLVIDAPALYSGVPGLDLDRESSCPEYYNGFLCVSGQWRSHEFFRGGGGYPGYCLGLEVGFNKFS
jgi:hypothetical protein